MHLVIRFEHSITRNLHSFFKWILNIDKVLLHINLDVIEIKMIKEYQKKARQWNYASKNSLLLELSQFFKTELFQYKLINWFKKTANYNRKVIIFTVITRYSIKYLYAKRRTLFEYDILWGMWGFPLGHYYPGFYRFPHGTSNKLFLWLSSLSVTSTDNYFPNAS